MTIVCSKGAKENQLLKCKYHNAWSTLVKVDKQQNQPSGADAHIAKTKSFNFLNCRAY